MHANVTPIQSDFPKPLLNEKNNYLKFINKHMVTKGEQPFLSERS